MEEFICNCGKIFVKSGSLKSHARFCEKYEKKKRKSIYKIGDEYKCECGKIFEKANSLNAHFSFCIIHRKGVNSNRKLSPKFEKSRGWRKGLTKETDNRIKIIAEHVSLRYKNKELIPYFQGKHHTAKTKERLSAYNSGRNNGYIKTKYFDVYCPLLSRIVKVQGTWELKYAEYLNKNNIGWLNSRKISLKYKRDGMDILRTYYPDFYLPKSDTYIEIKGYYWKSGILKIDDRKKMEKVIEYNPDKKIIILMKGHLLRLGILI